MDVLYLMERKMRRRGLSRRTIDTYLHCMRRFLRFFNGNFKKVRRKDILGFIDYLIDRRLSKNTLNVHINALRFAVREILGRKVMARIKCAKISKNLPVFLTKKEIVRLFSAVKNPVHKLMLELMYSSGLRVSELVNLKKKDLDLDTRVGWVRMGKGEKDRAFIIARRIVPALKRHIERNNSVYVFSGRRGRHLHIRSVQAVIKKAAMDAGIKKNVHPHSLRHSFATHLIEDGCDIFSVQSLLGHSRSETTRTYVHMAGSFMSVNSPYDSLKDEKKSREHPE